MKAESASAPAEAYPILRGSLTGAERTDWLRLIRTEQIGPVTFWRLIHRFGSATRALEALPNLARSGGRLSSLRVPTQSEAEDEIARALKCGACLAACGEETYPPLLAETEVPPPLLYQKGDPALWRRPAIAIVGARRASVAGLKLAGALAGELGAKGIAVVSGLARGIDAAAHRASQQTGTAAILAGGIDIIYPPEHAELYRQIGESGIIVSECPPGFQPRAQDFPRRNRIISGASLGVIVVEAAERSGSLITARLAAEQNREVFAVPGHPLDPRAKGPNELLKSGAILATCADDILAALERPLRDWPAMIGGRGGAYRLPCPQPSGAEEPEWNFLPFDSGDEANGAPFAEGGVDAYTEEGDTQTASAVKDAEPHDLVRGALQHAPVTIDEVVRATGLSAQAVTAALIELELAGIVERHGLQRVSLRGN
jgi:DNA processing protein